MQRNLPPKLFLLDASMLIELHHGYYHFEQVPEFWEWLIDKATAGHVKVPLEIYEELMPGRDKLAQWAKDNKKLLVLDEDATPERVGAVVSEGYAADLTDYEVDKLGCDPFLIAYALGHASRYVVTNEASKPSKERANRRIPDVCDTLKVKWCNGVQFLQEQKFSTDWDR